MSTNASSSRGNSKVRLKYQLLRNTTSPDEAANGVKSFVVNLSALEILGLNTEANLRNYIPEYNKRKRNNVHLAIRNTIDTEPQRFITRNSGFVITGSDIKVDDDRKVLELKDASLVNGAQSQGEIARWAEETLGEGSLSDEEAPFFVRAEIIVDADAGEVVETAIARNTATKVKSISQAGARGHLNELEASIQRVKPGFQIQKSETDQGAYDTRKILQYARLLMPLDVSLNDTPTEKLRPYKNPEQCLTDFSEWFTQKDRDDASRRKYEFTIQIAPYAIDEFEMWQKHEGWNGQNLWEETKRGGRTCRRSRGKVVWVSPGLVFPIVGAMSEFVVEEPSGTWSIRRPTQFRSDEMISRAVAQFRALGSDPMQMGRSEGAYDALRIYPRTIVEVIRSMGQPARA